MQSLCPLATTTTSITFRFTGLQNTVGQSKTLQELAMGGGNLVGPLVHIGGYAGLLDEEQPGRSDF